MVTEDRLAIKCTGADCTGAVQKNVPVTSTKLCSILPQLQFKLELYTKMVKTSAKHSPKCICSHSSASEPTLGA